MDERNDSQIKSWLFNRFISLLVPGTAIRPGDRVDVRDTEANPSTVHAAKAATHGIAHAYM